MDRREILTVISGLLLTQSGCINESGPTQEEKESVTMDGRNTSEGTRVTVSSMNHTSCKRDKIGTTSLDYCQNVEFTYAGVTPVPVETKSSDSTPSNFRDYVVLRLSSNSDAPLKLRGCINSVERTVVVSKQLEPTKEKQILRFGPFSHHGVNEFLMWVESCDASVKWP